MVEVYDGGTTVATSGADTAVTPGTVTVPAEPGQAPALEIPAEQQAVDDDVSQAALELIDRGSRAFVDGRYAEARHSFLRAVMMDDSDGYARLFYAFASFAMGDYELAAVALRRSIAMEAAFATDPIDIRGFYPDEDTFKAHVSQLNGHIEANPEDKDARFVLAYVHYASGEPGKAIEMLSKLTAVSASDETAAQVLEGAKQVQKSLQEQPELAAPAEQP